MKRIGWLFAATAVVTAVLVPSPVQAAPVRYLDPVFEAVEATTDIVYGRSVNHMGLAQDLHLDLYEPAGDTVAKRPVFIWAHGGYFTQGGKHQIGAIRDFMTLRGWVVISIQYRLNPTLPNGMEHLTNPNAPHDLALLVETVRDAQHDMQAAIRWARANAATFRLDPDRIATGGHSAGATTSVAVAYNSDDPGGSGNPGYPSHVNAAIATGTLNAPFFDIHPDPLVEPPVAKYHGLEDESPWLAPFGTCLLVQLMLNVCEVHLYPGEGHHSRVGMDDWPAFLYRWVIQQTEPPLSLAPGTLPTIPAVRVPSSLIPRIPL